MSKPKKRDAQQLYVPKGVKPRESDKSKTVNESDLVDGIAELSIKSVNPCRKSTPINGKVLLEDEVPDSWEKISENDIFTTDYHDSLDEVVKQDAQYDYLTMPIATSDTTELTGLDHVIEIHDFIPSLLTADLAMPFASFKSEFQLKWVDDTHALGIFSSNSLACKALAMEFLVFKVRPMSEATSQSRAVAKKVGVTMRPVGERPKTSASTARRMVANALGVRVNISKEQRDKERRELQEAKEKKRKEKLSRVDPWKD